MGVVVAITATATVCGSLLFVVVAVGLAYFSTREHHASLLRAGYHVTPEQTPRLAALVQRAAARLGPGPVEAYVTRSPELNAYTFGLDSPKVVVLHEGLLRALDADEIHFVVAHELGHVRLGHTWLNSLVGGLAGIPSPMAAFAILHLALRWWNRACEHSADRAGLLATGKPHKAISALLKLASGGRAQSPEALQRALARVEAEDDDAGNVVLEALGTHPLMARRIAELRKFAASRQYRRLTEANPPDGSAEKSQT